MVEMESEEFMNKDIIDDGDMFWEMRHLAIPLSWERHMCTYTNLDGTA